MDLNASYNIQIEANTSSSDSYFNTDLNWYYYTSFEILVGIVAVIGNALVIAVFSRERRLRRRTNYYIVSLAVADLLVGLLGIPFAILTSVGLPSASIHTCLFSVSLLMVLCTISIFCLVAVSVDRYWAILHPMDYSRNVRTRTALVIIGICWFSGSFIGFIPLMGWHQKQDGDILKCYFLKVMDYNYLVFAYFATIIAPALLLAVFYIHIYHVVLKQIRRMRTLNPEHDNHVIDHSPSRGSGTMLRVLGAAQKREVKATQNLSIIVLFFMVCWIPLYTINCTLAFCNQCIENIHPIAMNACIILSHVNSAGNPLLYAYHLKDFRAAMKRFILCMVGVKTQPYLIRPNGSQVTTFNSYYQQHRCKSQQYLPQLLQEKSLAQSRSEVPLMHMLALKKQEMKICPPSLNGDHLDAMSSHQVNNNQKLVTSAIVRNTVHLATAAVHHKHDLWRISSSSDCDLPSISGESYSSECNYKRHREKYPKSKLFDQKESDNDEVMSLMCLNLHSLDNRSLNSKISDSKLYETLYDFNDFTDLPTHIYSSEIIATPANFGDLNDTSSCLNARSKSCANIKISATNDDSLREITKDESVFHVRNEVFTKKLSASTICCEFGRDSHSLKYNSVDNLTL